jgi:hypothetical protein
MANRHIKIINGRKYYYESIRKGKKVTSKYLGPVDERKRKPREEAAQTEQAAVVAQDKMPEGEDSYIG